jgi:DNA-binding NtrC family response regulator
MSTSNLLAIKQRFGIIGRSPLLDAALDTAVLVAPTDLSVLITGESGVGKEAFSKIIHTLSARKHNPFMAVNCGSIPAGTINSELFGHEKGAFTGAMNDRKGYFESVDTGTIFLDEIGEMPLDTQAYLLRILENGEFVRVGSSKVQKTNVRITAATNNDLEEQVSKGRFREDLYYRLNNVRIRVPALKDRPEDIPLLFKKFASDYAERYRRTPIQLDERAEILMENYRWAGNIRELKSAAEQLSVLSQDKIITSDEIIRIIPNILNRNLPASAKQPNTTGDFTDRDLLYKLLFDMKNDLNDLKSLVFELIRNNNLRMPDLSSFRQLQLPVHNTAERSEEMTHEMDNLPTYSYQNTPNTPRFNASEAVTPIILQGKQPSSTTAEVVDEKLSLEDMEKDMILKAIKKHNGRRKEAADDLGISERTLYRKIKQYDI